MLARGLDDFVKQENGEGPTPGRIKPLAIHVINNPLSEMAMKKVTPRKHLYVWKSPAQRRTSGIACFKYSMTTLGLSLPDYEYLCARAGGPEMLSHFARTISRDLRVSSATAGTWSNAVRAALRTAVEREYAEQAAYAAELNAAYDDA